MDLNGLKLDDKSQEICFAVGDKDASKSWKNLEANFFKITLQYKDAKSKRFRSTLFRRNERYDVKCRNECCVGWSVFNDSSVRLLNLTVATLLYPW